MRGREQRVLQHDRAAVAPAGPAAPRSTGSPSRELAARRPRPGRPAARGGQHPCARPRIPCRRSCSENPARVVRSCSSLRSATNVPPRRPTVLVTSPRRASLASACRSVIRLTPNQAARSCSVGSGRRGEPPGRDRLGQPVLDLAVHGGTGPAHDLRWRRAEQFRSHRRRARPLVTPCPARPRYPVTSGASSPAGVDHRGELLGPPDGQVVDQPDQHDDDRARSTGSGYRSGSRWKSQQRRRLGRASGCWPPAARRS